MRKYFVPILATFLLSAGVVLAAPVINLFTNIAPATTDKYENGTSTLEWLTTYTKNLIVTGTCTGCGGGGGSGVFPFSVDNNYGQQVYSTSTPTLWFKSGLFASSTSIFANASTSQITITGNSYYPNLSIGGVAISNSGVLYTAATSTLSTISGTLGVAKGGTGQTSFLQGWLGINDSGAFISSTSPTVAWLTSTSTATSTFGGGINISNTDCFAVQGTCLQTFVQNATAYKQAANYATAAVLSGTPTYANGSSGVGATLTEIGFGALSVDGQAVSLGQRILVKNQADQTQNGVYTVSAPGSGIASYVLTRSTDYNTSLDIYAGTTIPVLAGGTVNGDSQWTESTTGTITVGTSNIAFIESSIGTAADTFAWPFDVASYGVATTSIIKTGGLITTASSTLNIFAINNLGTAGFVKTAAGTGALSVDTSTYLTSAVISGSCSGGTTCSGTNPLTINSFVWPWVLATYGTQALNSTSTGLWFTSSATPYGLIASSTFTTFASTTLFSSSGSTWLTNTKSGALSTDSTGLVVASTTGIVTAGTGISLDNSTRQIFGGSLAITNSGVISGSCTGGTVCSGTNPLTINSFVWPFTLANVFGTASANSTSTLTQFVAGLTASSTVTFGNPAGDTFTWSAGRLGLGTSSPFAQFAIFATSTDSTAQPLALFAIASSSKGLATSTLFSVSNIGTTTLGRFGACSSTKALTTDSSGNITCGAITATGDGIGGWFTNTSNFGINTSATSTAISAFAAIFASSTSRFDLATVGDGSQFYQTNFQISSTSTSTIQAVIQNKSATTLASADWIAGGDLMTNYKYYGDYGCNSSAYTDSTFTITGANDCYLYSTDAALSIGAATSSSVGLLKFFTGGSLAANERFRVTNQGYTLFGTTSPFNVVLGIATSTGPQFGLTDGSQGAVQWFFRAINNLFYIGTSSPTTYATSTLPSLTLSNGGQVSTSEQVVSTSTAMFVDWLTTPNQVDIQILASAMTIGFNNASTSGMTKRIAICNGGSTASTVTWSVAGLLWAGGTAPTQTVTKNKCDLVSCVVTQATSTVNTTTKVFCFPTQNF